MILNYSCQIASGYKRYSSVYIVVIVHTFAICFNKLIVLDNTFRFRWLGRKILAKLGPPMEKLVLKCGSYFVFLNIIITPKQKTSTIIPEQVITM